MHVHVRKRHYSGKVKGWWCRGMCSRRGVIWNDENVGEAMSHQISWDAFISAHIWDWWPLAIRPRLGFTHIAAIVLCSTRLTACKMCTSSSPFAPQPTGNGWFIRKCVERRYLQGFLRSNTLGGLLIQKKKQQLQCLTIWEWGFKKKKKKQRWLKEMG